MRLDPRLTRLVVSLWVRLPELGQRGQAMVEYSTISFFILGGLAAVGMGLPLGSKMSLVEQIYSALQTYVLNIYYSLGLAAV
jgi:hypothetical protein